MVYVLAIIIAMTETGYMHASINNVVMIMACLSGRPTEVGLH